MREWKKTSFAFHKTERINKVHEPHATAFNTQSSYGNSTKSQIYHSQLAVSRVQ